MTQPHLESLKTRLENAIALAQLLERVDRSGKAPDPEQYRALVQQLGAALSAELPPAALEAILNASPAAAEIYENLHYERSGLSRSSLERSVAAEMAANQVLHRIATRAGEAPRAG